MACTQCELNDCDCDAPDDEEDGAMADRTPARSTYLRDCGDAYCPGHLMCFACRTDVCTETDCGGCACGPEPCAWASYKPDCEPSDPEWPPDMVVGLDRTLRLVGGAS